MQQHNRGLAADASTEGAFAASNSALHSNFAFLTFGTGGTGGAYLRSVSGLVICVDDCPEADVRALRCGEKNTWIKMAAPIGQKSQPSGIFSVGWRANFEGDRVGSFMVVGGDYQRPNDSSGTAAFTTDSGKSWQAATTPPHGYRSAVAYDPTTRTWITVGPNGTDISTDDGRNWRPSNPPPSTPPTPTSTGTPSPSPSS